MDDLEIKYNKLEKEHSLSLKRKNKDRNKIQNLKDENNNLLKQNEKLLKERNYYFEENETLLQENIRLKTILQKFETNSITITNKLS
tara:strand:+ start:231 stop:491 length:261 start_codon:yes stop_codon:yes gene_type:complete